jgi:hypothetical protein
MTDIELLECTQSVYDFLIDDTDIHNIGSSKYHAFKKMNDTLIRYEFTKHSDVADVALLTLTLNGVWKIYEQNDFRKLLRDTPKDFFSSTKSHDFYRTILRDLKLKLYL